ncbi:hypothetical protein RN001_003943 [Aquatica leii]|uniref:Uncharacterized protein n=1 Tax=Aquatica leii TaxID=1421715 RepID=A0AAN7SL35_9COLE|nr:hypothetical protein RN001_003943 [Aquatica leii]
MFPKSDLQNKYIVVTMDYFTKTTEAYAIPNQETATVAGVLDREDWVESGSSGDDIDFTVFEQEDIEIFKPKDLNLGDFVMVTFKLTGKRSTTTYRYVAKILEILLSEEEKKRMHTKCYYI